MAGIDLLAIQPSVISKDLKGKYILLYGKPKVGKTSFAVQAPKAFVCAFELGTNALAGTSYHAMQKWTDMKSVIRQLKDPKVKEKFETIVIDTVSVAFDLCEKFILQREGVEKIGEIPWGGGWGMVKKEFQDCLREITMLGYGLILICHSKEHKSQFTDEEGNALMSVEPNLSKNAYEVCNSLCDVIGYINVEFDKDGQSSRYLYTRQTPTIFAGSRYKYLEPRILFGYEELEAAIGDALDMAAEKDGAKVVDKIETIEVARRSFNEVMSEAKEIWVGYLHGGKTEEEQEYRGNILNDLVVKIFGKSMKLSAALPSQQELVELFIEEAKDYITKGE